MEYRPVCLKNFFHFKTKPQKVDSFHGNYRKIRDCLINQSINLIPWDSKNELCISKLVHTKTKTDLKNF